MHVHHSVKPVVSLIRGAFTLMLGAIETNGVIFTLVTCHNSLTERIGGTVLEVDRPVRRQVIRHMERKAGRVHVCVHVGVDYTSVMSRLRATLIAIQGPAWQWEYDFSRCSAFPVGT